MININFSKDCNYPKQDPDSYSKKLQNCHKKLWSKQLPNNTMLELEIGPNFYYYLHWNGMRFSSDTMNSTYSYTEYAEILKILPFIPDNVLNEFKECVYTIGNFIIFPKGNGHSINQDRGSYFNNVKDRFDLTLECIRLFYLGKQSPLYATLIRYKDFFDLFGSFTGYVNFFLLQDLIDANGKVKFYLPFDNFKSSPLFSCVEDYLLYKQRVMNFIKSRNKRIDNYIQENI